MFCFALNPLFFPFFVSSLLTSSSSSFSETQLVLSVHERVVFWGDMGGVDASLASNTVLGTCTVPSICSVEQMQVPVLEECSACLQKASATCECHQGSQPRARSRAGTGDRQREMILQLLPPAWKYKAVSPATGCCVLWLDVSSCW